MTRCYACGQCTDLAAMVPPIGEWLCYDCVNRVLTERRDNER